MFTGLIETTSQVKSIRRSGGTMNLSVDLGNLAEECKIGDSIAINGVCLTISEIGGNVANFNISGETITKTSLGKLQNASYVNVERAMKPTERFGGHFVLGHVDGIAKIEKIDTNGEFADFKFSADADLLNMMVIKGSVAVDGISLTISKLDKNSFNVAIIPHTLKQTTLNLAKTGDYVNIEVDIIIKAVKQQLENILPKKERLSAEKLRELGF